jgi:hypothetical protein
MENIGHQGLESHVLDTGDIFGSLEIFRCSIKPTLSGVVHEILPASVRVALGKTADQSFIDCITRGGVGCE